MANAVYWIGQDGNIWYKDSGGTRNMGSAAANAGNPAPDASGFYDPWAGPEDAGHVVRFNAQQIADPAVQQAAPTNPTGTTKPALNTAAVSNTQRTIDQIAPLLSAALGSEDVNYGNTKAGFDSQQGTQQKTYDTSTTTNQQNYDSNFMDSIRSGIKGLGGLMALLRGSGAAGGTAEDQARDIVGGVTSNDIRTGADTQKGNQSQLDATLSSFLTNLKQKRQVADDTHANNISAINRDSNTQLQDLYSKMAGFYGDAGDTGNANRFMGMAGDLTPAIAANSRTQTSPYDTTPVPVQAPQLTAFAAPTQPNVLAVPSDGQVGSGIFTIGTKKKDSGTVPVPALAGA